MPLLKPVIKAQIKAVFEAEAASTDDPSVSVDRIADKLATAIIDAIKSQTIVITGTAGPYPIIITTVTIT